MTPPGRFELPNTGIKTLCLTAWRRRFVQFQWRRLLNTYLITFLLWLSRQLFLAFSFSVWCPALSHISRIVIRHLSRVKICTSHNMSPVTLVVQRCFRWQSYPFIFLQVLVYTYFTTEIGYL